MATTAIAGGSGGRRPRRPAMGGCGSRPYVGQDGATKPWEDERGVAASVMKRKMWRRLRPSAALAAMGGGGSATSSWKQDATGWLLPPIFSPPRIFSVSRKGESFSLQLYVHDYLVFLFTYFRVFAFHLELNGGVL